MIKCKGIIFFFCCIIVLSGCDNDGMSVETSKGESGSIQESFAEKEEIANEENLEKREEKIFVNHDELVELATIDVKVLGSHETNIVNDGFTPSIAKEGAKFIVVDITVVNTTNKTFMYDEDGDELIDDEQRAYNPVGSHQYIENNIDLRDLSPDVAEEGSIVFEVPSDSKNFYLKYCKGGSSKCFYIPISPEREE